MKCANCNANKELHHYKTLQCPVGGREAPLNREPEWMDCRFAEKSLTPEILAFEAGYRACERGENPQEALAKFKKLLQK